MILAWHVNRFLLDVVWFVMLNYEPWVWYSESSLWQKFRRFVFFRLMWTGSLTCSEKKIFEFCLRRLSKGPRSCIAVVLIFLSLKNKLYIFALFVLVTSACALVQIKCLNFNFNLRFDGLKIFRIHLISHVDYVSLKNKCLVFFLVA